MALLARASDGTIGLTSLGAEVRASSPSLLSPASSSRTLVSLAPRPTPSSPPEPTPQMAALDARASALDHLTQLIPLAASLDDGEEALFDHPPPRARRPTQATRHSTAIDPDPTAPPSSTPGFDRLARRVAEMTAVADELSRVEAAELAWLGVRDAVARTGARANDGDPPARRPNPIPPETSARSPRTSRESRRAGAFRPETVHLPRATVRLPSATCPRSTRFARSRRSPRSRRARRTRRRPGGEPNGGSTRKTPKGRAVLEETRGSTRRTRGSRRRAVVGASRTPRWAPRSRAASPDPHFGARPRRRRPVEIPDEERDVRVPVGETRDARDRRGGVGARVSRTRRDDAGVSRNRISTGAPRSSSRGSLRDAFFGDAVGDFGDTVGDVSPPSGDVSPPPTPSRCPSVDSLHWLAELIERTSRAAANWIAHQPRLLPSSRTASDLCLAHSDAARVDDALARAEDAFANAANDADTNDDAAASAAASAGLACPRRGRGFDSPWVASRTRWWVSSPPPPNPRTPPRRKVRGRPRAPPRAEKENATRSNRRNRRRGTRRRRRRRRRRPPCATRCSCRSVARSRRWMRAWRRRSFQSPRPPPCRRYSRACRRRDGEAFARAAEAPRDYERTSTRWSPPRTSNARRRTSRRRRVRGR